MQNNRGLAFLAEFKDRGFFYQCTDEEALVASLNSKNPAAYIGFDATATSLHVGSLMQIMIFRLMQKHNIKPIVLIGGGTTKVGDPSFKDEARKLLSDEDIAKNAEGIKKSISKFVNFGSGPTDAIMVDNSEWLDHLNYMSFLRDYGRHFSINRMLSFESVKARLERDQSLSFLEFNYMILQAYDFMILNRDHNCILQCGGSDQWGNIVNGIELTRKINNKEVYGLTTPLITTASGVKMGKTVAGAIWLNEDLLSPYDYYQFWRNVEDADVFRFMRLYTDLPLEEIHKLEQDKSTNINEYKKLLAFEATKLCHGQENADQAAQTAQNVFEKGSMEGIKKYEIKSDELSDGLLLCELFTRSGLTSSNSEARRLINGGGAKLNNEKVTDEYYKITVADFSNHELILAAGKKRFIKILLLNN
jgi:tyrosyl-tRNA synthetase